MTWGNQMVTIEVLNGWDSLAMEGGVHDGWDGLAMEEGVRVAWMRA